VRIQPSEPGGLLRHRSGPSQRPRPPASGPTILLFRDDDPARRVPLRPVRGDGGIHAAPGPRPGGRRNRGRRPGPQPVLDRPDSASSRWTATSPGSIWKRAPAGDRPALGTGAISWFRGYRASARRSSAGVRSSAGPGRHPDGRERPPGGRRGSRVTGAGISIRFSNPFGPECRCILGDCTHIWGDPNP
jgi:hypothetical protein